MTICFLALRALPLTLLMAAGALPAMAQTPAPNSAFANTVQRNVNQQARIEQGVKAGALTGQAAAKLERGQAHVDRKKAMAARDGQIGAKEQRHIQQ